MLQFYLWEATISAILPSAASASKRRERARGLLDLRGRLRKEAESPAREILFGTVESFSALCRLGTLIIHNQRYTDSTLISSRTRVRARGFCLPTQPLPGGKTNRGEGDWVRHIFRANLMLPRGKSACQERKREKYGFAFVFPCFFEKTKANEATFIVGSRRSPSSTRGVPETGCR